MGSLDEDDAVARERVASVLNDKWTLERLLGVGGMAAVYAGRHRNGARAAIKVLHPELARNADVRERFRREAYAANKVEHRGVVKVVDDDVVSSGPDAGLAYLVMELLEGESLQDRLERGEPVGERESLEVARAVLEVLQVAHGCGVVHRDLKPENLFFAREEGGKTSVKVLDFGLARLVEAQAITSYGLALGTPSFMSPEQAAGRVDEIDGRTDLFSLAATGFRLRTGQRIHEAEDAVELVKKMARSPAPSLRSVAPDVSAPYARVIDRALQFRREDRYESAAAMQVDVERALAELDGEPPRPPSASLREATIEISASDLEPVEGPGARAPAAPAYGIDESIRIPKRRSLLPWLVLLVLGGLAALAWRNARWVEGVWTSLAGSGVPAVDSGEGLPAASSAPEGGAARPRTSAPHRPAPPRPSAPGAPGGAR
jgi:serine/threonine protein kinase